MFLFREDGVGGCRRGADGETGVSFLNGVDFEGDG